VKRPALSQPTEYGYDEVTQEVRCRIQGQDRFGGAARGRNGAELAKRTGPPEPDLWLEEAGSRQLASLFARGASASGDGEEEHERETAKLFTKIGQLTVERDFLAKRPGR